MTELEGKQTWKAKFCALSIFQLHKSHALFFYRFYTSPDVVCKALLLSIFCCNSSAGGGAGAEYLTISLGACTYLLALCSLQLE